MQNAIKYSFAIMTDGRIESGNKESDVFSYRWCIFMLQECVYEQVPSIVCMCSNSTRTADPIKYHIVHKTYVLLSLVAFHTHQINTPGTATLSDMFVAIQDKMPMYCPSWFQLLYLLRCIHGQHWKW